MSHHTRGWKGDLYTGTGRTGPERWASAPPSAPSLWGQLRAGTAPARVVGRKPARVALSAGVCPGLVYAACHGRAAACTQTGCRGEGGDDGATTPLTHHRSLSAALGVRQDLGLRLPPLQSWLPLSVFVTLRAARKRCSKGRLTPLCPCPDA